MTEALDPTYGYTADGRLADDAWGAANARLRRGAPWLFAYVGVVLVGGLALSLHTYTASLPTYLGRVLLIGLVWGGVWLGVTMLPSVLLWPLLGVWLRRLVQRRFPDGSRTLVRLADNDVVIEQASVTRSVPYRRITRVALQEPWLLIRVRGVARYEWLPLAMFPAEAIVLLRDRVGRAPVEPIAQGEPMQTRQLTVPDGWADHVANQTTRDRLVRPRLWLRRVPLLVVAALLALLWGWGWLLLAPGLVVVLLVIAHLQTRAVVAKALPPGSVARTEVFDDRLVSHNATATRHILFQEITAVEDLDDVLAVGVTFRRGRFLIARELVPEPLIDRLRSGLAP